MRAAIAILALAPSVARADPGFATWAHYEVTGMRALEGGRAPAGGLALALARVGGFYGRRVGFAASLDFGFGATIGSAGFLYEASLLPIGLALRPTERSLIALATGIAVTGATPTLDDAVAWPVELTAEATLGPIRVLARGRASFLAASDARQHGARWADELDATAGIRIGRRFDRWQLASGNGYFVGASYREIQGTTFVGLVLGYSVDAASQRVTR